MAFYRFRAKSLDSLSLESSLSRDGCGAEELTFLTNTNQPTAVSPRGRPTTGEPYRALSHREEYSEPLK